MDFAAELGLRDRSELLWMRQTWRHKDLSRWKQQLGPIDDATGSRDTVVIAIYINKLKGYYWASITARSDRNKCLNLFDPSKRAFQTTHRQIPGWVHVLDKQGRARGEAKGLRMPGPARHRGVWHGSPRPVGYTYPNQF